MFIARNDDLIILAKDTREELEKALKFLVYTSIDEIDYNVYLYDGKYLTEREIAQEEEKKINMLTMTSLDFVTLVKSLGITDQQIEDFLNANLDIKHQLQFCQNVYCGVAKALTPITIGNITITPEMVEKAFIDKHSKQ